MPKFLAAVAAHPYIFCGVTAVAIAVILLTIYKNKKSKEEGHKYSSADDTAIVCQGVRYYYDPETKTVKDSPAPAPNVRKRQVPQKPSEKKDDTSTTDLKKHSEEPNTKKPSTDVKEVQTESNYNDLDINYNKNILDKNVDLGMSSEERVNEYFRRNHFEADSESKKIRNDMSSQDDDDTETLSTTSLSSNWSNVSTSSVNSSDDNEKAYKKRVRKAVKKALEKNKEKTSRTPSICSLESESSVGSVLTGNSDLCKGCEENPTNTRVQPCNHRYMCSDCAPRIFRLYKKCKVCRGRIEQIIVEE